MNLLETAKRIFDQALELPEGRRSAFLHQACGHNAALRGKVERMLAAFYSNTVTGNTLLGSLPNFGQQPVEKKDFRGTNRFHVLRLLGSGAFGTVYHAWDCELQVSVAVKVLHSRSPDVLFRFKKEFRSLAGIRHPNLAGLYELFSEGDQWFFTMELVEGEGFLDYVRPGGESCHLGRIREALGQLVQAVQALHAAKRLHRDLKPANILITRLGRLVVLDFGLVHELKPLDTTQSVTVAGTPAYMAPEQVLIQTSTEASDWYAVGVILFQALTGKLPYSGQLMELFAKKAHEAVPRAREVDAQIPEDLDAICQSLLDPKPERRAAGIGMLAAGSGSQMILNSDDWATGVGEKDHFVGRREHLAKLNAGFSETMQGNMCVVVVEGRSGIGKTALVKRFLTVLAHTHADVITLKGRCYEFESVPYKGLDALLDELSQYLQRLPSSKVEALLPRDAFLLPKLFPVLGRVSAISSAPVRSALVPDAQELRQRTFMALRELLARLADRQPVVIWIDDLQWGDRDSSTFLAELCAPPFRPPLLLLLTYRSEEISSNATLQYLNRVLANQEVLSSQRQIVLEQLSHEESRDLLQALLVEGETNASDDLRAKILDEASGHPLFLQQLVRYAATGPAFEPDEADSVEDFNLGTVLRRRIQALPAFTGELLAFISIAAQPLSTSVLFAATASSGDSDERAKALALLTRERFARISGSESKRKVEPFHDQVRISSIQMLTPASRREKHAKLAGVLSAEPDTEPQILVTHYQQAGDSRATFEAAIKAAQPAEYQLAFDRAAVFYEAALNSGEAKPPEEGELYRKLADSLARAGRGRDSANAYLRAARNEAEDDPWRMKRLAMDQLMRSGYIDEAMGLFSELTRSAGVWTPKSRALSIVAMIWARLQTRALLLLGLPQPASEPRNVRDLARLDVLHTGGIVLQTADPGRAAYFQIRYILEALRVREPLHLATAIAFESSVRVAAGTSHPQTAHRLLDRAEQMAAKIDSANLRGFVHIARAYVDYLLGRIPDGIAHSRKAVAFLRDYCTGVAWELTVGYVLLFYFLSWAGRVKEVSDLLPQLVKEGTARGDINMEASLILVGYGNLAYVCANRAEDYLRERARCLQLWSREGMHLQHSGALHGLVETHLYLSDYRRARQELLTNWDALSHSFIFRWQILRTMFWFLRGRVAMACLLDAPQDPSLRAELRLCIRRLERTRSPWSPPMTHLLRAALAAADRRTSDTVRYLEVACQDFDAISLQALAAATQYRCGIVSGGKRGHHLVDEATRFFLGQNVQDVQGVVRMLVPGRWAEPEPLPKLPS